MAIRHIFVVAASLALICSGSGAVASEGSIVGWGDVVVGGDLSSGFERVAAGGMHSVGLKSDGSVVAWGYNAWGECVVPSPNRDFVAVAAGGGH